MVTQLVTGRTEMRIFHGTEVEDGRTLPGTNEGEGASHSGGSDVQSGPWRPTAKVSILAPPLTRSEALSKFYNFPMPQFPHL